MTFSFSPRKFFSYPLIQGWYSKIIPRQGLGFLSYWSLIFVSSYEWLGFIAHLMSLIFNVSQFTSSLYFCSEFLYYSLSKLSAYHSWLTKQMIWDIKGTTHTVIKVFHLLLLRILKEVIWASNWNLDVISMWSTLNF